MTTFLYTPDEVSRLCRFAREIIGNSAFEGYDIGGDEVQDIAERLGLIVGCKYDPDRHGPSEYAEAGDPYYEFAPLLTRTSQVRP